MKRNEILKEIHMIFLSTASCSSNYQNVFKGRNLLLKESDVKQDNIYITCAFSWKKKVSRFIRVTFRTNNSASFVFLLNTPKNE